MPDGLSFIKMHGCGNDYVFVDCFSQPPPADPSTLAKRISDRHTSIGSDGLILMLPPASADADAQMRMFNSDGTEGAMCGNALRCFAMWLHQSGNAKFRRGIFGETCRIAMQGRTIEAIIQMSDLVHRTAIVSIQMGPPVLEPAGPTGKCVDASAVVLSDVLIQGKAARAIRVSFGNPHAVVFVKDLDRLEFTTAGPAIETHPQFPDRTNVEFAQIIDKGRARVRVWERGSGETMACGSGACAVVVAGIAERHFHIDQTVTIEMRGGDLRIMRTDDGVLLQGPAVETFRGVL